MSTTWKWYSDAGLTVPLTRADFVRTSNAVAVERRLYFGSTAVGKKLQAASDPGGDQLQLAVADATTGEGVEASDIALALSSGGLATATPGAPVSIGTTLYSGVAGAIEVFVSIDSVIVAQGDYDGITIGPVGYVESTV